MATGFKQATVNASDVPSTQTDFPSYVDLSRLGITTLAEAESVRVYSDSSKTTELAREIVSATEMHVKVPSLTSTFTIYVDWDGVRSDYAVTATYGRNAVWTDYARVYHMDNTTDSTGNTAGTTAGGVTMGGITGKIGKATAFDGTDDRLSIATAFTFNAHTLNVWTKQNLGSEKAVFEMEGGSYRPLVSIRIQAGGLINNYVRDNSTSHAPVQSSSGAVADNVWVKITTTNTGTAQTIYTGGVSRGTGTKTTVGFSNIDNAQIGSNTPPDGVFYGGDIDEVRVKTSSVTQNWETTEFNNQNDEATFWGTWTDAGGGVTANNSARRQHLMMM